MFKNILYKIKKEVVDTKDRWKGKQNSFIDGYIEGLEYAERTILKEDNKSNEIVLTQNGITIKIVAETESDYITIKTYRQMQTSKEFKLDFTQYVPMPSIEQILTTQELWKMWEDKRNED